MRNETGQMTAKADFGWTLLGWAGALAVVCACLGPVWPKWSSAVVGPYGGVDAVLQAGLLEWSARHWQDVPVWLNLPIFYPMTDGIGLMDSLLGQSWLVMPARLFPQVDAIVQYNLAFLGSLLLAAVAMGALWRASGGPARSAGVSGLLLVGAPFTMSQLGHLNQLPPPFVIFGFAALVFMLHRFKAGISSRLPLFLLSCAIVLQATWGWYGLAYAAVGGQGQDKH